MVSSKLITLFALAAPLASALQIVTPTDWTSADPVTLSWTAVNGDPQSFTVELQNDVFHKTFGIANNVPTADMSLNLTLPVVPAGDGFTLQFINPGNASDIFAQSGDFVIGTTISSSSSSSSSSTSSVPGTATMVTPTLPLSSSGFGTTNSPTSSSGSSGSTSGTESSSASVGSNSTFNNGAVPLGISNANILSFAVMAIAALVGARFVGL